MYEHWIIAIEVLLLLIIGFIPPSMPDGVVNVTISFVCSLQVNSFRKIKNLPYATTMCTGNLRSGTEKLFRCLINKEEGTGLEAAHYFGIIALFILGAVLGTVMSEMLGIKSIWFCCCLLAIVFTAMWRK
ncbi:MAG: YoaK family protein [[Clostridium] scindens]